MRVVAGMADVADVDAFVADLDAVGERHGVVVQAVDARYVVDRAHLARAVELADRAFERGEAIARDRAVEILLYAAGRRQIDRALTMGVGEGKGPVAIVVHDPDAADDGDASRDTESDASRDAESDAEARAAEDVASLIDEDPSVLGDYVEALVVDFFDVGDAERAATDASLPDLVRERVALLTVEQ